MAVDTIVLVFILQRIDTLTQNLEFIIVTTVDIALVSLASAKIFADRNLVHLNHLVGQESVMPVARINTCLINTDGTFEVGLVGNLLRRQVIGTGSNLVQNVVLDETAQGIDTVGEVFKAMARCADIIGINWIIDGAGQIIESTKITLFDAIFCL